MPPQTDLSSGHARATLAAPMTAVSRCRVAPRDRLRDSSPPGVALLVAVIGVAALTSEREDWQPLSLVCRALRRDGGGGHVRPSRRAASGFSAGLMVQVTIMALLGPAPAVASALLSTRHRIAREPSAMRSGTLNNLAMFALLGLVGGLLFDARPGSYRARPRRAALCAARAADLPPARRREPGARRRVATGPRARRSRAHHARVRPARASAGAGERRVRCGHRARMGQCGPRGRRRAARRARDHDPARAHRRRRAQAAATTCWRSGRCRTSEPPRSRGWPPIATGCCPRCCTPRVASARVSPSRCTTARCSGWWRCGRTLAETGRRRDHDLDAAIAETRAIISSFHPATVRELGFEASLRAAVAPFPAARSIELTVRSAVDDRALVDSCCCPVAQELVVNAVKHASPTAIDVAGHRRRRNDRRSRSTTTASASTRPTRAAAVQAGHVGLAMVRRRVEDAGGLLEIATRTDGGTRSRIVVPVP